MKYLKDEVKINTITGNVIVSFTLIQVLLDLSATFSVKVLDIGFNLAIIIRGVFILYAVIYLILYGSNIIRVYVVGIIVYFSSNIIYYSLVYSASPLSQVSYLMKTVFFSIIILFIYCYSNYTNKNNEYIKFTIRIQNAFTLNALVYSSIIIIGYIFNFGFRTYNINDPRVGSIGLFLSGNEMGSFLLFLGIFSLLYLRKNKNVLGNVIVILTIVSNLIIGTKTSGAIALVLFIGFLIIIFEMDFMKDKRLLKIVSACLLFSIILLNTPSLMNYKIQKSMKDKDIYYSNLVSTDPVDTIDMDRYSHQKDSISGNSIYSISTTLKSDDSLKIFGYFYPQYIELGHPKFVEMSLVVKNENSDELIIPITNTYNRHVVNEKETEYSSRFAGIEGEVKIDQFLELSQSGIQVEMKILYKGQQLSYPVYDNLNIGEVRGYLAHKENNKIYLKKNTNVAEKPSENSNSNTQRDPNNFLSFILSGRNNRIDKYIEEVGEFSIPEIIFGKGPIQYNSSVYHLEMDIIETIFVFGIIGGILQYGFFLLLLTKVVSSLLRIMSKNKKIEVFSVFLLVCLFLSLFVGFFAGHTFLNPRVSYGLAMLSVFVWYHVDYKLIENGG